MKKLILMLALTSLLGFSASAQNRGNRGSANGERPDFEQMMQKRSEKMAQDLALEGSVAEQFTSLYTQYRKDQMAVRRAGMQGMYGRGNRDKAMTDEEIETRILAGFENERKAAELKIEYYQKFRKIMDVKLIQKMYMLERQSSMPQGGYNGGHGGYGGQGGGRPMGGQGGQGGQGSFGGDF